MIGLLIDWLRCWNFPDSVSYLAAKIRDQLNYYLRTVSHADVASPAYEKQDILQYGLPKQVKINNK